MVTAVWLETADVVTVNVLLDAPALTVTLPGTDAAAELSDSVTIAPPAGAGALRVTVPVEDEPPDTAVGLTESAVKLVDCDCVTPSAAKSVVSPRVATSCAVVLPVPENVVAVNDALGCAGRHADRGRDTDRAWQRAAQADSHPTRWRRAAEGDGARGRLATRNAGGVDGEAGQRRQAGMHDEVGRAGHAAPGHRDRDAPCGPSRRSSR